MQHRIVSAVKRVQFVSGRMSHRVLRGRWCNIIVLNLQAPSEEKTDDSEDNCDVKGLNLRKLSDLEVWKQFRIKISDRFAAFENLNDRKDMNRTWENIKESLGLYELKQHKPRFDEECLRVLDQRKQAKMQWVQDASQSNANNLNNLRREPSRHFGNKKKEYLKAKID